MNKGIWLFLLISLIIGIIFFKISLEDKLKQILQSENISSNLFSFSDVGLVIGVSIFMVILMIIWLVLKEY